MNRKRKGIFGTFFKNRFVSYKLLVFSYPIKNMSDLKIFIQGPKEELEIEIEKFATVERLKELIEFLLGIPKNHQKLSLNYETEHWTLNSLGVVDGTKIKVQEFIDITTESNKIDIEETKEKETIQELIENQSHILHGKFDEGFDLAKKEKKILISMIYSEEDTNSVEYIKKLLKTFKEVYKNFIIWIGNIMDMNQITSLQRMIERNNMKDQLTPKELPMISFTCYCYGEIMILDIIQGTINDEMMDSKLNHVLINYDPLLKEKREIQTETSQLLQDQDYKYMESLKKDKEKEIQKEKERLIREEQLNKQKEELKEKELKIQKEKEELEKKKIAKKSQFNSEPSNGIKIGFKLPNGSRIERRFLPSHSIETLFDFLELFQQIDPNHHDLLVFKTNYTYNEKDKILEKENITNNTLIHVKEK